jgi:threonine dehydrogenase-like Zn-dependent dehydrogenase
MQLCRWAGADTFACDRLADRLEMARRLGAVATVDAGSDVAREVRGLTSGRGADCTLLAAVGPEAFQHAVDATRPGGRILAFASTAPGERVELDLGALCAAEKQILTSYSASVEVQDVAAQLVFGREVRVRELISHQLPIEEAARAVELAARPAPGVLKVVLRPRAGAVA